MKHALIKFLIMIIGLSIALVSTSSVSEVQAAQIETKLQNTIRPSYPFPDFLSTGPYIWYKDTEKKPIKGHTYRIATFTVDGLYRVYLEKVIFGDKGCCLEIVDYRELIVNEAVIRSLFPNNKTSTHGFKLIRWVSPTSFTFNAYGGSFQLSEIDSNAPTITELKS